MIDKVVRDKAYGQEEQLSFLDCFGVYLSIRKIRKEIKRMTKNNMGGGGGGLLDLGAGYNMTICSRFLTSFSQVTAVDVSLNENIYPTIFKIQDSLENALPRLPESNYNIIFLNSVLEHITEPLFILRECHRLLTTDGKLFINVPTWRGKYFLELSAFKLKREHAIYEMNDHKMYYDQRDLWPLLVKAGFLPENIHLVYHKFGLNLFGICKK